MKKVFLISALFFLGISLGAFGSKAFAGGGGIEQYLCTSAQAGVTIHLKGGINTNFVKSGVQFLVTRKLDHSLYVMKDVFFSLRGLSVDAEEVSEKLGLGKMTIILGSTFEGSLELYQGGTSKTYPLICEYDGD